MERNLKNIRESINNNLVRDIRITEDEKINILNKMDKKDSINLKYYGSILASLIIASILIIPSFVYISDGKNENETQNFDSQNNMVTEIEKQGESSNSGRNFEISEKSQQVIEELRLEKVEYLSPNTLPMEGIELNEIISDKRNKGHMVIRSFYNIQEDKKELFRMIQINLLSMTHKEELVKQLPIMDWTVEFTINDEKAYFTKWDNGTNDIFWIKDNVIFRISSKLLSKEDLVLILKDLSSVNLDS